MDLLAGSSSEDDETSRGFKINKQYAKGYQKWRSKEEKQRLIDKYGKVSDTDSSSSSDEEEIRTTRQMDKDWLRAYAVVHFQQPRLYKEGEKFFHDEAKPMTKKKEKATTLKDYERNFLLEKGGIESEDESSSKPQGKSYYEEQEEIKKSFKEAVGDSSSDESEGEELLVKKQRTKEEQTQEENEYLEWLKGERDQLEDWEAAQELAPLKAYWNDPNLPEKERVLRDYVLNNGYMDQEDSEESEDSDEGPDHGEEEEFLEKAEQYEHKYNFRHEEPGAEEIKSYPRVIEESVRNKDTRRIEKRKRRMEKKRMERADREEEIRLLQKLHKEERQEKLARLRDVASNPALDYDLEADFNPEQHDKIMQAHFGTDYYGDDEATEKPTFEYDAAVDEDEPGDWWSERLKEEGADWNQEDDPDNYTETNFNMDADYDPTQDTKVKGKKKKLKKDKKTKKKLPLFDPSSKTFDEYIDEYLKDKIGTIPFTYREVLPNDFGLSTEEILQAPEKELNAWVSVKKMSQYRSQTEESTDKRKFSARAQQKGKKKRVLPSLFKEPEEVAKSPKKKKKKKAKEDDDTIADGSDENQNETSPSQDIKPNRTNESLTPCKVKEKIKKKRKSNDSETREHDEGPMKKKKKGGQDALNSSPSKPNVNKVKIGKSPQSSPGSSALKISKVQTEEAQKKEKKKITVPGEHHSAENKEAKTNGTTPTSLTKRKKKKKKSVTLSEPSQKSEAVLLSKSSDLSDQKKKKKKKLSISNFGKSLDSAGPGQSENRKKLEQKLSQLMSASRLSKYGIGPKAAKGSKKKKKKKSGRATHTE